LSGALRGANLRRERHHPHRDQRGTQEAADDPTNRFIPHSSSVSIN
jgi:hypothetical protein